MGCMLHEIPYVVVWYWIEVPIAAAPPIAIAHLPWASHEPAGVGVGVGVGLGQAYRIQRRRTAARPHSTVLVRAQRRHRQMLGSCGPACPPEGREWTPGRPDAQFGRQARPDAQVGPNVMVGRWLSCSRLHCDATAALLRICTESGHRCIACLDWPWWPPTAQPAPVPGERAFHPPNSPVYRPTRAMASGIFRGIAAALGRRHRWQAPCQL